MPVIADQLEVGSDLCLDLDFDCRRVDSDDTPLILGTLIRQHTCPPPWSSYLRSITLRLALSCERYFSVACRTYAYASGPSPEVDSP